MHDRQRPVTIAHFEQIKYSNLKIQNGKQERTLDFYVLYICPASGILP